MTKYIVRFERTSERDAAMGLIREGLVQAPEIVHAETKAEALWKVTQRLRGTEREGSVIRSITRE
jgi:hypothetical protein